MEKRNSGKRVTRMMFDEIEEEDENGNETDKQDEDIVTPYSICNLTNSLISVTRLNYNDYLDNIVDLANYMDKKTQ